MEENQMTPEQETKALIVAETENLISNAIVELKRGSVTDEAIAHLKVEYGALAIAGIDDLNGYKAVKAGATKLMKLRTAIEAKRKELTDPAEKFKKAVKAEADRLVEQIKPIEEQLKQKAKDHEDAVESAKRAEFQRRITLLTENGYQLVNGFYVCGPVQVHSDEVGKIAEAQLEVHIEHGRQEIQRRAAEEKRRQEEAERQRQEREALEEEKAELARMRAELEAQKSALQQTYEVVEQSAQPATEIDFTGFPKIETQQEEPPYIQNMNAVVEASVPAEQPHPQPQPTFQAPVPRDEFERGYNAMRVELDQLLKDPNAKLSKQILHNWLWSRPFPQH